MRRLEQYIKRKIDNYKLIVLDKMKKQINKIKDNHNRIYFLLFSLRKCYDDRFIDLIINRKNILRYESYGSKNKDKCIYFIDINSSNMGFGAYFRWVLHLLYESDSLNAVPVVRYGDKCPYKEEKNIMGTNNPYEYYFMQSSELGIADVFKSFNVILFNEWSLVRIDQKLKISFNDDDMPVGYKNITDEYLIEMSNIFLKYVRLNTCTHEYIKNSIKNLFSFEEDFSKILAVHVRGTDFALHWDNHPNIVSPEDYFYFIDEAFEKYNFKYIFLATDDSERLQLFRDRYKDKLLYYKDVNRTSEKINVSFVKNTRENNYYLNGLEVLRDMYTMAQCGGFIAGLSQVSISVRIINRSRQNRFIFEKVISKGIYEV